MNCPHCPDTLLVMTERQGVEIDYCPRCRGVWLDRGERDKLIERATADAPARTAPSHAAANPAAPHRPDFVDSDYRHRGHGYGTRKRKSLLGEIFDFD